MPESPAEPGSPSSAAPAPGGASVGGASGASVGGLQRALSAGTLTSAGITTFYLERIHRLNPALHAVITVNPDAAAEARASDAARAERHPPQPAGGHSRPGQGQHPGGRDAHHGRLARAAGRRRPRRVPGAPPARGRSRDHRQGQPVGVGELPVHARHQRLVHAGRPDRQPARAAAQPVRLQFRLRSRRSRRAWPRSRWAPKPTARSSARPARAASSASSPRWA